MKISITNPVVVELNPVSSYVVEVESMMGDGDGYSKFNVGIFKEDEMNFLECLLETLNRMSVAFPHGMSGSDDYEKVLGFPQWFGEGFDLDEMKRYYLKNLALHGVEANQNILDNYKADYSDCWNMDATSDYQSPESFVGYKVFFYDENGIKYDVEVTE